jgi:peroxiredoxin family protein
MDGKRAYGKNIQFLNGRETETAHEPSQFPGIEPEIDGRAHEKKNVATLEELFAVSQQLGIRLIACEMAMNIFGITREDLIEEVKEVIGVPTFLEYSKDAHIIFV